MNTGITPALTGIERRNLEEAAKRRAPRRYMSLADPWNSPWPLDFCIWLNSEAFGDNRIRLIVDAGGTWLGAKTAW